LDGLLAPDILLPPCPRNRVGGISVVVRRMCLVMQKPCVYVAGSSKEALWLSSM